MEDWIDVAPQAEFGEGQTRTVETGKTSIAVVKLEGEYYAFENVCSHEGWEFLGCGIPADELIKGDEIMCPRHGARFAIRTGEALTPPAFEPLRTYPVRVENGMVQIRPTDPH
jgi:3-phenylpropionate/trans-cinnamate dioxygenase ferredoxin subunit